MNTHSFSPTTIYFLAMLKDKVDLQCYGIGSVCNIYSKRALVQILLNIAKTLLYIASINCA